MFKAVQQVSGRARAGTLSSGLFLLQLVPGIHLDQHGPSRMPTDIFVVSAVVEPCLAMRLESPGRRNSPMIKLALSMCGARCGQRMQREQIRGRKRECSWPLARMGEAGVCMREDLLEWGLSEVWGV